LSSLSNVAIEGKHLVILCNVSFGDKTIASYTLIDYGATGAAFVDEDFARHHQLPLTPLKYPRALEVINSRPISSGDITHSANAILSIYEHREQIPMFVTKLGHYPIVLGIFWMELHNMAIQFSSRTLTFRSQYYIVNCNPIPTVAHAISSEPLESALCSLVSKVAPEEPAVSAGAGNIGTRSTRTQTRRPYWTRGTWTRHQMDPDRSVRRTLIPPDSPQGITHSFLALALRDQLSPRTKERSETARPGKLYTQGIP